MSALVSIIIPFHNEERYLEGAIHSVLAQTYADWELILVDDGSKDKSPAIAEALCKRDPRIQLVSIIKGGPGRARNEGITLAKGAYLTFLDADDILLPGALQVWVNKIEHEKADIVISKFRMKHGSGSEWITGWKGQALTTAGMEGIRAMYEYRMASTVWAKLYKAAIVRELRFPEGHWFEDRYFLLSYFLKSNRIAFEDSAGLDILSRQDSLTRRLLSEEKIRDAHDVYLRELALVRRHDLHREFTRLIDRHQINALIETMIILYYDRKQLPDRKGMEQCLSEFIISFVEKLKQNGTRIGIRDRMDLLLLQWHRIAGWGFTYRLLPLWKQKKCRSVLLLKSF